MFELVKDISIRFYHKINDDPFWVTMFMYDNILSMNIDGVFIDSEIWWLLGYIESNKNINIGYIQSYVRSIK